MELFNSLASVGLTTKVLQIVIVLGIAIFIIGMFWRLIVVGAGILFCVVVFAMPSGDKPEVVVDVKPVANETVVIQEVPVTPVSPPVAEVKPKSDEEMFIEDCQLQTKYTQAQCKALWNEHKDEIEAVKYRNKGKKNFMMKVNYVRT